MGRASWRRLCLLLVPILQAIVGSQRGCSVRYKLMALWRAQVVMDSANVA